MPERDTQSSPALDLVVGIGCLGLAVFNLRDAQPALLFAAIAATALMLPAFSTKWPVHFSVFASFMLGIVVAGMAEAPFFSGLAILWAVIGLLSIRDFLFKRRGSTSPAPPPPYLQLAAAVFLSAALLAFPVHTDDHDPYRDAFFAPILESRTTEVTASWGLTSMLLGSAWIAGFYSFYRRPTHNKALNADVE